jgi:hypothetical protein
MTNLKGFGKQSQPDQGTIVEFLWRSAENQRKLQSACFISWFSIQGDFFLHVPKLCGQPCVVQGHVPLSGFVSVHSFFVNMQSVLCDYTGLAGKPD